MDDCQNCRHVDLIEGRETQGLMFEPSRVSEAVFVSLIRRTSSPNFIVSYLSRVVLHMTHYMFPAAEVYTFPLEIICQILKEIFSITQSSPVIRIKVTSLRTRGLGSLC